MNSTKVAQILLGIFSVANDALRGANLTDTAYIQQWIDFADNEILPASCTWVFPCMGIMQYNKQVCVTVQSECVQ